MTASDFYTHKAVGARKKLRRDICAFIQIVVISLILLLLLIVFERVPQYINAGKSPIVDAFGWTDENAVKGKVQNTKFALFHSKWSRHATNPSHDILTNFYDYACDINEPPMVEIFETHTKKTLQSILTDPSTQKLNWMQNCIRFHSFSYGDKLKSLADKTRTLFSRIEEIDSEFELLDTISFLHSRGIREPLHLNTWPNGLQVLSTSFRIHDRSNSNVHSFLKFVFPKRYSDIPFTNLLGSYHKIHDFVNSGWTAEMEGVGVSRANYTGRFHIDPFQWVPDETIHAIHVHAGAMGSFERAILLFSQQDWKNYLRVAAAKSLMHQLRLLTPSSKDICNEQILELFPLRFCRKLSKHVKNLPDIVYNIETGIADAKEFLVGKNYFELDAETLSGFKRHLDGIALYINKCSINQTRDRLQAIETQHLNMPSSYMDSMLTLVSTPDWQSRRNLYHNQFYKNLATQIQKFNAKTTPLTKTIRFYPGMLIYPDNLLRLNSLFYHILLRWPAVHEYAHWAWVYLLQNQKKWSPKLKQFEESIRQTYLDGNNFKLHSENTADDFGILVAYHSRKYDHITSIEDDRQFFLGVARFFCARGSESISLTDPHATGRQRLQNSIRLMLDKEFRQAFNLTTQ